MKDKFCRLVDCAKATFFAQNFQMLLYPNFSYRYNLLLDCRFLNIYEKFKNSNMQQSGYPNIQRYMKYPK